MHRIARISALRNQGISTNLRTAREYLAALEAVAHMGCSAKDPSEVRAALKVLAQPSDVLKRLAGLSGDGFPEICIDPFNISDTELERSSRKAQ